MPSPDVLADLESIPDTPQELYYVKQCLRALQGRLAALEAAPGASAADLASLQQALAALTSRAAAPAAAAEEASYAQVKRTSNQVIPTGTWTAISFDAEIVDTNGYWVVGSPTRFSIRETGRYAVGGAVVYAVNATGTRHLAVFKNGVLASLGPLTNNTAPGGAQNPSLQVHGEVELTAGDYVELRVFQDSGGDLSVLQSGDSPTAWIRKIS